MAPLDSESLTMPVVTSTVQQAEKDINEKLICLVQELPSLYTSSDPLYHDRNIKYLLWRQIAAQLARTGENFIVV